MDDKQQKRFGKIRQSKPTVTAPKEITSQRKVIYNKRPGFDPLTVTIPFRDLYHWTRPELKTPTANKITSTKQSPTGKQGKPDVDRVVGFLRTSMKQTPAEKKRGKSDVVQLAGFLRTSTKQVPAEKKIDVSQLAGFLRKRPSSEVTRSTTRACTSTSNVTMATKCVSSTSAITMSTTDVSTSTTNISMATKCLSSTAAVTMTINRTHDVHNSAGDVTHFADQLTSAVQSTVCSNIGHGTDLGQDTIPICETDDKKSVKQIGLNDDFDYNLDLMEDYTLKLSELTKKPTPFWFETDHNAVSGTQFILDKTVSADQCVTPDTNIYPLVIQHTDLNLLHDNSLLAAPKNEEFDLIMNSRRGYTYSSCSIHRGIKRKIAYDDENEVPVPCKRPRRS